MFVYLLAMILYNFTVCTNIIVTTYMTQNITLVWLVLGSVLQTVTYYTFLITFFFKAMQLSYLITHQKKKNSFYSINLNLLHEILPFLLPSHWKLMNPESPFLPSLLQKHQDQLFITYVDFIFFVHSVLFEDKFSTESQHIWCVYTLHKFG